MSTRVISKKEDLDIFRRGENGDNQTVFKFESIEIELGVFQHCFLHANQIVAKEIIFDNCKFIGYSTSKKFSIKTSFKTKITFNNCNFERELVISDASFEGLYFIKCDIKEIYIENSTFSSYPIVFQHFQFGLGKIFFNKCLFFKALNFIGNDSSIENVTIRDSVFLNDYSLGKKNYESIRIYSESSSFGTFSLENINIHRKQFLRKSIYYTQFSKQISEKFSLFIKLTKSKFNVFEINNIHFTHLHFNEIEVKNRLSINNINGYIRETESTKKIYSDFEFSNNSINSLTIRNSDFRKTNILYWDDNQIVKRFLCDFIKWPLNVKHYKKEEGGNKKELYLKYRHSYRNLKSYMLANNNTIDSAELKGLELESYRKMLSPIGKFKSDFGNYIMLSLNRFTNNYGRYWILPILIMLLGGIIPFSLIIFFSTCSLASVFDYLNYYFVYLNPTHSFKFIDGVNFNFASSLLDFLFGRVWNSYLIYQVIRGFRKYSSK